MYLALESVCTALGIRGGIPIPEPRRPNQKSLQAEATTCRAPDRGTPGFFSVTDKVFFSVMQTFSVCVSVAAATVLDYSNARAEMLGRIVILVD